MALTLCAIMSLGVAKRSIEGTMNQKDWKPPDLSGAKALIVWFGCCPSFHDAEIRELDHQETSVILV